MASNMGTGNPVHFTLLNDDVLPKGNDNKLLTTTTETSKTDNVVEDEVFVNENETARAACSNQKEPSKNLDAGTSISVTSLTSQDAIATNSGAAAAGINTSGVSAPTTTTATTRRPSYTSKAPSALTNLPKIDDSLQTFGLHNVHNSLLEKRSSTSGFEENLRNKDLLSLHGQASFESIDNDEYSNPGTPTTNTNSTPLNGQMVSIKPREKRMRADVFSKGKWEMAARANVLTVRCRDQVAELYKHKFGSGSKGRCIKAGDKWLTPIEFEAMAGRASCKDWKRSIRFHGHHLQKLIEDQFLTLHAISCTCGICCGDDTMVNTGPVKLFQSVKRKRSHINSNLGSSPGPYKRKSFSDEYRARGGSLSVDSDVFTQEEGGMPPMTPLTPITPLTPHTPFGANCLTPLPVSMARPNSPPKSIMLQVPVSQPTTASMGIPVKEVMQQHTLQHQSQQQHQSTTKLQSSDPSQQPWVQLEETAAALVIMANKLKLMIEQAKINSEASKDSAVTQAKIQAENEKAEILRRSQFHSMQIISVGPNGEALQQGSPFTLHVPEVCQNCGREALMKCTGCNKAYYCGAFCHAKDWQTHRIKCRKEGGMPDDPLQHHHQHPQQQQQQQPVSQHTTTGQLSAVDK